MISATSFFLSDIYFLLNNIYLKTVLLFHSPGLASNLIIFVRFYKIIKYVNGLSIVK